MDAQTFNTVIEAQLERSTSLLKAKNSAYNPNTDKLQGFKTAADLKRESTKAALAGMMAKHTVSVFDMCQSDEIFPIDVWNEKITDHINYLLLLRAVVEEERVNATSAIVGGKIDSYSEYPVSEAGDLSPLMTTYLTADGPVATTPITSQENHGL